MSYVGVTGFVSPERTGDEHEDGVDNEGKRDEKEAFEDGDGDSNQSKDDDGFECTQSPTEESKCDTTVPTTAIGGIELTEVSVDSAEPRLKLHTQPTEQGDAVEKSRKLREGR